MAEQPLNGERVSGILEWSKVEDGRLLLRILTDDGTATEFSLTPASEDTLHELAGDCDTMGAVSEGDEEAEGAKEPEGKVEDESR